MGKISVIVPVYNVENYLDGCLESLVAQTYQDIEIVCVNDGSTDGSREKLRQWAERDGRVRVTLSCCGQAAPAKPPGAGPVGRLY